ncbi:MAG: pilus assembly protein PilP [Desulfobacterota bacterium]|nr:pilus assembly protein PilP [Thermodesulfobacteriota bacterium]
MNNILMFICIAVTIAGVGCSTQEQAPQQTPRQPRIAKNETKPTNNPPATAQQDVLAVKKAEQHEQRVEQKSEYSYDATGKPDPFEPLVAAIEITSQAKSPVAERPAVDKPLTPLQRYDLSDLFLVAIAFSDNGTTALIEDNSHNGYIVKEGMQIGKNDGIIKKILKNSIIVEEKITDSSGQTETKITTLTMHTK